MRLAPTLNGGLRIDAEMPGDWDILRCIVLDAEPHALADRLADHAGEDAEDWNELVRPDLVETFGGQVEAVRESIGRASEAAAQGAGPLFIPREEAELWFGAINQARLALHERHDFSSEEPDPGSMGVQKRSAFYRYQFYMAVQNVLLNRIMG